MLLEELLSEHDFTKIRQHIDNEKNRVSSDGFQDFIEQIAIYAVYHNDIDLLSFLAEYDLDVNYKNNYFSEEDILSTDLLGLAVKNNNLNMMTYLLNNGANPDSINSGHSVLSHAVGKGFYEAAKLLIDRGANINLAGQPSLLNMAIVKKNIDFAAYLIEKGVKVKQKGQADPLLLAIDSSEEMTNLILESSYRFSSDCIEGDMPLEAFAMYENLPVHVFDKIIKKMSQEIDINYPIDFGLPALHRMVYSGNVAFINVLVKYGADIEKRIVKEQTRLLKDCTPLFVAVHLGKKQVVKCLIELGADVNVASDKYSSPLVLALTNGNEEIFSLLVKSGADYTRPVKMLIEKDSIDVSPQKIEKNELYIIHHAAQTDKTGMIRALLEAGDDINKRCESQDSLYNGATPLILAASQGALESVELLIENKADINTVNTEGYTALAHAALINDHDIVKSLIDAGANIDIRIKGKELIDYIKDKEMKVNLIERIRPHKNLLWKLKHII